jgi:hypothetical protein
MLSEQEYVERHGNICLFCRSDCLEWDSIEVNGDQAYQEVYCHDCGAAWLDVYQMVGYQIVTVPDPSILATLGKQEA